MPRWDLIQEPADNATSASPSTSSHPHDVPLSNSPIDESPTETTDIFATNQSNNEVALYEDAPPVEPSATDCTEVITASLSLNKHTNVTWSVLNESGNLLESVLEALETQNTDRIADSSVPGTYAVLTDTEPMTFARIITSIGKNCVESGPTSLASALEALFARLEGIPDKSTSAVEIREVLEEIIQKAHDFPASDLVITLRGFPGDPSLKNHLPNAIGKLGR
jgi:hypothetical protein